APVCGPAVKFCRAHTHQQSADWPSDDPAVRPETGNACLNLGPAEHPPPDSAVPADTVNWHDPAWHVEPKVAAVAVLLRHGQFQSARSYDTGHPDDHEPPHADTSTRLFQDHSHA